MYGAMTRLVEDLEGHEGSPDVLSWGCPVPFFGEISLSPVATVGINPSNREFVGGDGRELTGANRRLETLASLAITAWAHASGGHVRKIAHSCQSYFRNNPYRLWFNVLDRLLGVGGASFYGGPGMTRACHIDLVPFATWDKWGKLPRALRRSLVVQGRRPMAELIRDSAIGLLVLNGRSVVDEFEGFAEARLRPTLIDDWRLLRTGSRAVPGVAYFGTVSRITDVDLDREVSVIGYNHNLQSSFGVTSEVMRRIGERVGEAIAAAPNG